jgi:hypothetical protein
MGYFQRIRKEDLKKKMVWRSTKEDLFIVWFGFEETILRIESVYT